MNVCFIQDCGLFRVWFRQVTLYFYQWFVNFPFDFHNNFYYQVTKVIQTLLLISLYKHIIVDLFIILYWHHLDKSSINILLLMFCSKWTFHHISQPWALPLMQYHSEKSILSKQTNNSIYIYVLIWQIVFVFFQGMDIIENLNPAQFTDYLKQYHNTICGRYPIGVLLNVSSSYYYLWKISYRCFIECKFLLFVEDIL